MIISCLTSIQDLLTIKVEALSTRQYQHERREVTTFDSVSRILNELANREPRIVRKSFSLSPPLTWLLFFAILGCCLICLVSMYLMLTRKENPNLSRRQQELTVDLIVQINKKNMAEIQKNYKQFGKDMDNLVRTYRDDQERRDVANFVKVTNSQSNNGDQLRLLQRDIEKNSSSIDKNTSSIDELKSMIEDAKRPTFNFATTIKDVEYATDTRQPSSFQKYRLTSKKVTAPTKQQLSAPIKQQLAAPIKQQEPLSFSTVSTFCTTEATNARVPKILQSPEPPTKAPQGRCATPPISPSPSLPLPGPLLPFTQVQLHKTSHCRGTESQECDINVDPVPHSPTKTPEGRCVAEETITISEPPIALHQGPCSLQDELEDFAAPQEAAKATSPVHEKVGTSSEAGLIMDPVTAQSELLLTALTAGQAPQQETCDVAEPSVVDGDDLLKCSQDIGETPAIIIDVEAASASSSGAGPVVDPVPAQHEPLLSLVTSTQASEQEANRPIEPVVVDDDELGECSQNVGEASVATVEVAEASASSSVAGPSMDPATALSEPQALLVSPNAAPEQKMSDAGPHEAVDVEMDLDTLMQDQAPAPEQPAITLDADLGDLDDAEPVPAIAVDDANPGSMDIDAAAPKLPAPTVDFDFGNLADAEPVPTALVGDANGAFVQSHVAAAAPPMPAVDSDLGNLADAESLPAEPAGNLGGAATQDQVAVENTPAPASVPDPGDLSTIDCMPLLDNEFLATLNQSLNDGYMAPAPALDLGGPSAIDEIPPLDDDFLATLNQSLNDGYMAPALALNLGGPSIAEPLANPPLDAVDDALLAEHTGPAPIYNELIAGRKYAKPKTRGAANVAASESWPQEYDSDPELGNALDYFRSQIAPREDKGKGKAQADDPESDHEGLLDAEGETGPEFDNDNDNTNLSDYSLASDEEIIGQVENYDETRAIVKQRQADYAQKNTRAEKAAREARLKALCEEKGSDYDTPPEDESSTDEEDEDDGEEEEGYRAYYSGDEDEGLGEDAESEGEREESDDEDDDVGDGFRQFQKQKTREAEMRWY